MATCGTPTDRMNIDHQVFEAVKAAEEIFRKSGIYLQANNDAGTEAAFAIDCTEGGGTVMGALLDLMGQHFGRPKALKYIGRSRWEWAITG